MIEQTAKTTRDDRAAVGAAADDVTGFHDLKALFWQINGHGGQMTVLKIVQTPGTGIGPNGEMYYSGIPVLTLEMSPNYRFGGGTPYIRSYRI